MADGAPAERERPTPRHDLDAERGVLGAVLLDNARLAAVAAIVTPRDFYLPAHAVIFEVMLAMARRGEAVDVLTLAAALRGIDRLNTVGGLGYLGEITDTIPTTAHAEDYARIVRDDAAVRRVAIAAEAIATRTHEHHRTADVILDFATAAMSNAARRAAPRKVVAFGEGVQEIFEGFELAGARGQRIMGLATGLRELDDLIAGLGNGQLVILAARPAMGKTSAALEWATHVAATADAELPPERRGAVLFFSLEMPRKELVTRALCAEARVDQGRVRAGTLTQDDMTALTGAASKTFELPLLIDDGGGASLLDIDAVSRDVKMRRGLRLIVIDYLQLMKASRAGMESREREVSEISRGLKELAKELDVPILALAQLNRGPESRTSKDKRPQLADLRDSGSIEQDADVVIFIYRDEVYNPKTDDRGIAEFIVAKQRNGPTKTVRARFIRELTKFENLAEDEAPRATSPTFRHDGSNPYAEDGTDATAF